MICVEIIILNLNEELILRIFATLSNPNHLNYQCLESSELYYNRLNH